MIQIGCVVMLGLYRKETVVSAQIRLISPVLKHCVTPVSPLLAQKSQIWDSCE